jgi:hypothetical protein
MDEIGGRLEEIPGLIVLPFAADRISMLPAALISFPSSGAFDLSYKRGLDQITLFVTVFVSKNVDLAARNALSPFISGSGVSSIRQVVHDGSYRSCDHVRITDFNSLRIKMADATYFAASFAMTATGRGGT